jgi:2-keto-4-pentenoate hydratase/2-oxohepta-3-ene-1,7-dioic acid hydratase in catechol pathway
MKLARLLRNGPDGPRPRIVAVDPERDLAIDLARSEQVRLERRGCTPAAAHRLAEAHLPQDIAAGLGSPEYRDDLERAAAEDPPDDAVLSLKDVRWLPPLQPPRFRDFMAFEQHFVSARAVRGNPVPDVLYQLPAYYKGSHLSLIAHEQTMAWPGYSEWMDFELELGFVVGGGGVDLTAEEAEQRLFGVTLLNDFSARDRQFEEVAGGLGPAKGKDFATALGPWITTTDELDLLQISLTARVNGEAWSSGSSGAALWSAAELIAYLSTAEPLVPGELIGSGTVGGGCGLELGNRLVPGDVVELRGSGLGSLRTHLGQPQPLRWTPMARTPGQMIDGGQGVERTPFAPPRTDAPAPPVPRR